MKLFGLKISKKPSYSLADLHRYQEDLAREEDKLEKARHTRSPEYIEQLEITVHVMREVLVRMLEKL